MEMEIDGVGGVSILAKAKVFRSGVHFPAFSFEKHAETEGFGKVSAVSSIRKKRSRKQTPPTNTFLAQMAKRMKFSVVGLPHYTIWHLYEPSVDDIRHMEEMENERKQREAEEKAKQERMEKIQEDFDDGASQWAKDKEEVQQLQKSAEAAAKEKLAEEKGEKNAAGGEGGKDSSDV